jgi:hypothetical protein
MQIALFFSGKVVNITKEHLSDIKKRYNPVCFASINVDVPTSDINEFLTFMNISPDCVCFEQVQVPDDIKNHRKASKDVNVNNVYGMFYHNKQCIELIKAYQERTNTRFNCIIKYRSDINNSSEFLLEEPIKENTVYIPKGSDWIGGINDQIAYGSFDTMMKYTNVIDCIKTYISQGINIHPEILLAWHIKMCFLSINRFNFVYKITR